MPFTEADATALRRAIATGMRRVSSPGIGDVEYQNTDRMLEALYAIEAALATDAGRGAIRITRVRTKRGW